MNDLCYLNGQILPLSEAAIHPLDRGFLFGDAVYEVVKVREGIPLHLQEHLERLASSLEEVSIPQPQGLAEACDALLAACHLETGSLFLEVTRGVAPRSHFPPPGMRPTVFILAAPHSFPDEAQLEAGLRIITRPDWRWRRCNIKTTSLLPTVLGKLAARDAGAQEVIFVDEEGRLREGGSSNVFVRRRDILETHPLDGRILPGVTRAHILHLAAELGLPVQESPPRLADREEWQEAFLCGTLTTVQGVVELNGRPVGDGNVGPWTRRLARAYAAYEESLLREARSRIAAKD